MADNQSEISMRMLAGIGVLVAAAILLGWQLAPRFLDEKQQHLLTTPDLSVLETLRTTGAPMLQEHPAQDYLRMLNSDLARLHSYGWVDQPGFVHIPIERALLQLQSQSEVLPPKPGDGPHEQKLLAR